MVATKVDPMKDDFDHEMSFLIVQLNTDWKIDSARKFHINILNQRKREDREIGLVFGEL